jgi:hypothetical protein
MADRTAPRPSSAQLSRQESVGKCPFVGWFVGPPAEIQRDGSVSAFPQLNAAKDRRRRCASTSSPGPKGVRSVSRDQPIPHDQGSSND